MAEFSHYSEDGNPVMVDISVKKATMRTAKATGFVKLQKSTLDLVDRRLLPKGDLFQIAKIAGIMAAKRNAELIPMCHPLALSFIDVTIELDYDAGGVRIRSEIRLEGKTGAEMEALTAVSIAALTVYDMCKAVDKTMVLEDIKLVEKTGGKSDLIDAP
ncbi:MAG TPA: cyclic pyranopterin monophosphate synthase MoaC [Spirochaetota bacterium]|nr:cyclic pyranopterin monophosphate synthase MoaC [Spirochaetota bacterium]HPC41056.1 cyclic pyranopterin monophosphate synthase MoaC [Spirochaetota bacterium]HPL18534.1 cyclic pyranopterin monophosphate synthase MoaC [Spirochaetota bacterium]HQF08831.1 cyclic pyranopterin monophosphate synthase MoaC [Spirochaetota bacterium]HQH97450.1 cyclic pyranopterin monophosphate synthase MoaC [Spirochaetota bacterium]